MTPQDVKTSAWMCSATASSITYEAEAEEKTTEIIVQKIFDELPVP
jgi:hypothetical protein